MIPKSFLLIPITYMNYNLLKYADTEADDYESLKHND